MKYGDRSTPTNVSAAGNAPTSAGAQPRRTPDVDDVTNGLRSGRWRPWPRPARRGSSREGFRLPPGQGSCRLRRDGGRDSLGRHPPPGLVPGRGYPRGRRGKRFCNRRGVGFHGGVGGVAKHGVPVAGVARAAISSSHAMPSASARFTIFSLAPLLAASHREGTLIAPTISAATEVLFAADARGGGGAARRGTSAPTSGATEGGGGRERRDGCGHVAGERRSTGGRRPKGWARACDARTERRRRTTAAGRASECARAR